MSSKILDIYTDYLICQNKYATATGLSDLLSGAISHDKITRYLNSQDFGSKQLWSYSKSTIRQHEERSGGVLILDDTIEEKPYTDENDIVCWHHSHAKNCHVKGMNILSCLARYGDVTLPIGYEIIHKELQYCDIKNRKVKRKSSVTKNEHFLNLIAAAHNNHVLFDYVLADNWFGSKDNFEYINDKLNKQFIIGIKSNRTVALTKKDKLNGQFQQVKSLDMQGGESKIVWLKGMDFPTTLIKKIFTNEDGSTGILYLVSNDLTHDAEHLYSIYKKRWQIEVYHKSIKQNASLTKSPTKCVRTQSNHIYASIIAFCKLEVLQFATATNHFALKYKLIVRANIAAMAELKSLYKNQNFQMAA